MKVYTASRIQFSGHVLVVTDDGGYFLRANGNAPPGPPTEYDWGYPGPAPLLLAFALLADLTGDLAVAERWHRPFADQIVRLLSRNGWSLTDCLIDGWLKTAMNDPNRLVAARDYEV